MSTFAVVRPSSNFASPETAVPVDAYQVIRPPVPLLTVPEPPPPPHVAPVPDKSPEELTCTHCVDPVIPVSVREVKVPAFAADPPMAGGDAR